MKDFPLNLKLNAAAIRLARALFYARHEVFGADGDNRDFDALSTTEKQVWITRAADVVLTMRRPVLHTEVTTGLRPTHAPVIGMIQPAQGA